MEEYCFICRAWDTNLLETAVESLTDELSQVYSDKPVDNYKISVACAFFFKFFNEVASQTGAQMVSIAGIFIVISLTLKASKKKLTVPT